MFKRIISLTMVITILMFACSAYAAPTSTVRKIFDAVTINATADVSSVAIPVKSSGVFGIWYEATSASATADVKLEVLMSYDTTAANFVEPDFTPDITSTVSDEVAHVDSIYPPPMPYMKIKCTGVASNPADTVITAYLFKQE